MQRQEQQKQEAQKKRIESYQPVQIVRGISFSLNLQDPKNDTAVQPSYLTPDYRRLAPEIVEKDLRVFQFVAEKSLAKPLQIQRGISQDAGFVR